MAYARFNGDWMADVFGDDVASIWIASTHGYNVARWDDSLHWGHKYGVYRNTGGSNVVVGTFDTPQEVVAMLKLLMASEEHDERR